MWAAALPARTLEKTKPTSAWEQWTETGRVHPLVEAAVAAFTV